MAKHRRWSDKPKSESPQEEKTETPKNEIHESAFGIKPTIFSGTKYVYLIAIAALLSGVFTPITLGVESESVIFGMLVIFLGLGGFVIILKGIKSQKHTSRMFFGGLAIIITSLILVYELADHSLFG
tara:strand:- start:142 stop:522 length:381 start_codon:yes stop_codon:yes gene_type:complete